MATFKLHIAKQVIAGKIITTKTECGRNAFTPNGAPNVIYKTNMFKMAYEAGEDCCSVCLQKSKSQGRV